MANMIAAYFGKAESAKDIFDKLEIAKASAYLRHLNQHEIIYIDFSQVPKDCSTYKQYIRRIQEGLFADLAIYNGNPLESFSADVDAAIVAGNIVYDKRGEAVC